MVEMRRSAMGGTDAPGTAANAGGNNAAGVAGGNNAADAVVVGDNGATSGVGAGIALGEEAIEAPPPPPLTTEQLFA